jgi:hypothetical protein
LDIQPGHFGERILQGVAELLTKLAPSIRAWELLDFNLSETVLVVTKRSSHALDESQAAVAQIHVA